MCGRVAEGWPGAQTGGDNPCSGSAMNAADPTSRHVAALLRRHAPAGLNRGHILPDLAEAARWFSLPGGSVLFEKGETSDAVYLLLSGMLGIVLPEGGSQRIIARIGPGEIVGEMGCISGEPRTATVQALRSSELLGIQWPDLEALTRRHPAVLTLICRTVVRRLAAEIEGRRREFRARTFSIATIDDTIDGRPLAEKLVEALAGAGTVRLVDRAGGERMRTEDFFRLETAFDHLVYLAEPASPTWSRRCLRQSDAAILVVDGAAPPRAPPPAVAEGPANVPLYLAITWRGAIVPKRAAAWIRTVGADRHFHVRDDADVARMARLLAGSGTGLVLSGGGARGLAHIGVARSLREHGVTIDVVAGTSIGGLIAAGLALELEPETLVERVRRFARVSPLIDLILPRHSLLSGRRLRSRLSEWFGDLDVEDLPIPFACTSADLSTGAICTHRSGPMQLIAAATTAIPGVFPPVVLAGAAHVDGGVLNNLPVEAAREVGAGYVIAVDVARDAAPAGPERGRGAPADRMNILELLTRVGSLGDHAQAAGRRSQCDVLIVPDVSEVGLLSFRAWSAAVAAGARAADTALDELDVPSLEMLSRPDR